MTIALEILEDGAIFEYPESYDDGVRELDDLLDRDDAGRIAPARYLAELRALVARHPEFIDGHAHLGSALLERDDPERALDAFTRGFALGERAIPSGFDGAIEWGYLENRPFLRAAHGIAICCLQLGRNRQALALMEKMLGWNPNDNQGVRYVIGSEYLRAGKSKKARSVFEAEGARYPPYRYELALLLLRKGAHKAAATSLRHGFVENGYIAEILCGNENPMPLAVWHGSSFADPESAQEYVSHYGDLWRRTRDAIAFLRWLHMHPKVMMERAAILEWEEALLWERDPERRRSISEGREAAAKRIDDALSEEIVATRAKRGGQSVFPWLHSEA